MTSKDFDIWNLKKKALNSRQFKGFVHEREIWWCALGINLGDEQNGKTEQFERPILVVKKFNSELVMIVPLIPKSKDNKYYFSFTHDSEEFAAVLSQLRVISTKRLIRKIRKVNNQLFSELKKRIIALLK